MPPRWLAILLALLPTASFAAEPALLIGPDGDSHVEVGAMLGFAAGSGPVRPELRVSALIDNTDRRLGVGAITVWRPRGAVAADQDVEPSVAGGLCAA